LFTFLRYATYLISLYGMIDMTRCTYQKLQESNCGNFQYTSHMTTTHM